MYKVVLVDIIYKEIKVKKILTFLLALILVVTSNMSLIKVNAQEVSDSRKSVNDELSNEESLISELDENDSYAQDGDCDAENIEINESLSDSEMVIDDDTEIEVENKEVENKIDDTNIQIEDKENINTEPEVDLAENSLFEDGIYYIYSYIADESNESFGVESNLDGSVSVTTSDKIPAQEWEIKHDKNEYLVIINSADNTALTVDSDHKVITKKYSEDNYSQKWYLKKIDETRYEIASALINEAVLSVIDLGEEENRTLEVASRDVNKNQFFVFSPVNDHEILDEDSVEEIDQDKNSQDITETENKVALKEGFYNIIPCFDTAKAVDVENRSMKSNVNAIITALGHDETQIWEIVHDDNGYISFINKQSGKALDVYDGGRSADKRVWLYTPNNSKAQKWIVKEDDDAYKIVSAINNEWVLDIKDGDVLSLQVSVENDAISQKFDFIEPVVSEKKESSTSLDELAKINKNVLPDGTYYIRTILNNSKVINTKNDSINAKIDVVIDEFDKSESQKWQVVHDEKGYVTFINKKSGKVMDVYDGGRSENKKIWQYQKNGSLAQKWIVQKVGTSYKVISALNEDYILDVKGGKANNNASLQVFKSNNSNAQRFHFISTDPEIKPTDEIVKSGYYYICANENPQYAVDVYNGSDANRANIWLYKMNSSFAQSFYFDYVDGYYVIKNAYSGKALDVYDGGFMPGTNVWQYTPNASEAQKWSIRDNGDGSYSFISVLNGMALDIYGAKIQNKSNIQVYTDNSSSAQKFVLKPAKEFYDGLYTIQSAVSNTKAIEIAGGGMNSRTNVQLYQLNGTESQKWRIVSAGDDLYTISNAKSGNVMDIYNGEALHGTNVWSFTYNNSLAQKWVIENLHDGTWRIVSAKNPEIVLGIQGGKADNKSNINVQKWQNTKEQKWIFKKTTCPTKLLRVEIEGEKAIRINRGQEMQLSAREVYTNAYSTNVQWISSDSNIISVSDKGKIIGKRSGQAVITAISQNDPQIRQDITIDVYENDGQLTINQLDALDLSKTNKLMIVAHPDDETFWGGGHLLMDDYLVVCFTNGCNMSRRAEFLSAMNFSGEKAIILDYPDSQGDFKDNWEKCSDGIRKDIKLLIEYKDWDTIVTHNPLGDTGHIHHKMLDWMTTIECFNHDKYDHLFYFGKFYSQGNVPPGLESNLNPEILDKKYQMIQYYGGELESWEKYWAQMMPYEYWIQAEQWVLS